MNKTKNCEFCSQIFEVKSNKKVEQIFCNDDCRNGYHTYFRRYTKMLIDTGEIDFPTIKKQVDKVFLNFNN